MSAFSSKHRCRELIAASRRTDYRSRVKSICRHTGMDLCLFVLWGLRLVVGTFLLSSERQNSKYGPKRLPTELYAPANGEGGKEGGGLNNGRCSRRAKIRK